MTNDTPTLALTEAVTPHTPLAELTQAVADLERIMQREMGLSQDDLNQGNLEIWAQQAEIMADELHTRAVAQGDFVADSELFDLQQVAETTASLLDDLFWLAQG